MRTWHPIETTLVPGPARRSSRQPAAPVLAPRTPQDVLALQRLGGNRLATLAVQRGKQLSSGTNPDLGLAGRLELKTSKDRARLVTRKKWNALSKKMAGKYHGYRKYAAIHHRNLMNDLGKDELVLLLRLRNKVALADPLGRHYAAIENKSKRLRQTAQHRTELLGEAVAAEKVKTYIPDAVMLVGFAAGAGIDQLWFSKAQKAYFVVEAKGPGAKLTHNRFAVRGVGAGGGALLQMSDAWVADRIPRLKTQHPQILERIRKHCRLKVVNGTLTAKAGNPGKYTLQGLVITASWNQQDAPVGNSMKKLAYTF
ncbi:hypothetical protein [Occultella gossypii]|uniref:Uncharacterized protein n=1 Tax=Occultella gossypii TaxID=2800820 RepID=A0ABS7SFK4_9MICO|nr:hypothetical protein [Occultella gossypii]MBZ2199146.1 hypothetical protein [Occultella gossypii]